MSILQEYESIRKSIGEDTYNAIQVYLDIFQDLYLSDIYYNQTENKKFHKWYDEIKDIIQTHYDIGYSKTDTLIKIAGVTQKQLNDVSLIYTGDILNLAEDIYNKLKGVKQ